MLSFFQKKSKDSKKIILNFEDDLLMQFPQSGPVALKVSHEIIDMIKEVSFDDLTIHSPGLKGYDWKSYIKLSAIRVAYAHHSLITADKTTGRILDLGSYFGNFSFALSRLNYKVDALDSYKKYGNAFSRITKQFKEENITVLDFQDIGYDLNKIPSNSYDAILFMGVIEHLAHTPKPLLDAINRILKKGGVLIMDTPNLAYQYKRNIANTGGSSYPSIQDQFETQIPFEGHHREYTTQEIQWILKKIGHQIIFIDHFNYSYYSLKELTGYDAVCFEKMRRDPFRREIIVTASKKL